MVRLQHSVATHLVTLVRTRTHNNCNPKLFNLFLITVLTTLRICFDLGSVKAANVLAEIQTRNLQIQLFPSKRVFALWIFAYMRCRNCPPYSPTPTSFFFFNLRANFRSDEHTQINLCSRHLSSAVVVSPNVLECPSTWRQSRAICAQAAASERFSLLS